MTYKIQKYRCALVKDGRVQTAERFEVKCSESALALFRPVFAGLPHEEVWMAMLNAKNDVLGLVRVGQGGLHGCALTPADVFRPAIAACASAVVIAHNHPSGDPTPSEADREMTRLMSKAAKLLGIYLLDHLILTRKGPWRALRDESIGLFDED